MVLWLFARLGKLWFRFGGGDQLFHAANDPGGRTFSTAAIPTKTRLIVGSDSGDVGLYELTADGSAPFATLQAHDGSMQFVAFSRESSRAFSGSGIGDQPNEKPG